MYTVKLLTTLVEHHQVLAYTLIFFGLVFEGEFFLIFTGVLAHLGALNFWLCLFFVLMGALGKTFLGYYLGGIIHEKWCNTKLLKYAEKRVNYFLPRFKTQFFWSIFASKFIIGANNLVILYSGFMKIDYKKFLKAEIISTIIWAPALLSLGYFFSYTALHISHDIRRFSLTVLLFVIAFIIFDKLVAFLYETFEEFYGS